MDRMPSTSRQAESANPLLVHLTIDETPPSDAFERSFWALFGNLYQQRNDLDGGDAEAEKEGEDAANSQ